MLETKIGKLFKNGSSQAVRLPAEFRFEGDAVYVTRDEITGDVILSTRPGAKVWEGFFELTRSVEKSSDYMSERPMNTLPAADGIFDDSLRPSQTAQS